VNSKFVKTAVVAGLALAAVEANAGTVYLGCTVPGAGSAGATVYSVDAYDNTGAAISGLPAAAAAGQVCSKAINAMLATSGATNNGLTTAQVYRLVGATNVTIATSGYSLQQFAFSNDASQPAGLSSASNATYLIGCTVPSAGTAGATVYSIDAANSAGSAISSGLNAQVNQKCSQTVNYANTTVTGFNQTGTGGNLVTPINVTIAGSGYSLQQFLVQ